MKILWLCEGYLVLQGHKEDSKMLRTRNWIWLMLLSLVAFVPMGTAQNIGAQLAGTITDPSGAVIPGAEVTLTAVDTGAVMKVTSSPDGLYSFFNLQAGRYEIQVSNKDRKSTRLNSSH